MKNGIIRMCYIFGFRLTVIILLTFQCCSLFAQDFILKPEWSESRQIKMEGEDVIIPVLKNQDYSYNLPLYSFQNEIKKGTYQFTYTNIKTIPAPAADVNYLKKQYKEVGEKPEAETKVVTDGYKGYISVGLFPYIKVNNQIHRITEITVNAVLTAPYSASVQKDYKTSSVLQSGKWYRITVDEDGVYKMDKAFLKSCGIDADSLNPAHINIYGNASGRLSELNSDYFYDDLFKNAIQINGDGDNVFEDGEAIVFYGAGPNRWDYNISLGFSRNQHIYSKTNSYFIHIDETDPPLRIANASLTNDPATDNVFSYNYYAIHENETKNLQRGGQRWYGELFDGELTQTFLFPVPDIEIGSPVSVRAATCSNAPDTFQFMRYLQGGTVLFAEQMSPAGASSFSRDVSVFTMNPSSQLALTLNLARTMPSVRAYLDFITISCRRGLKMTGDFMQFRDLASVGPGKKSQFTITNMTSQTTVWEISDKRVPSLVNGNYSAGTFSFRAATDTLREFVAFSPGSFKSPVFAEEVANQNLHALEQVDYVIVTHPQFRSQAERLANLHRQQGTSVHVVTTSEVYNEYSSGVTDATAIRRFVRMFYERAAGDPALQPKHLLLFGDGTYDPKDRLANNNYMVPVYEMLESEYAVGAMTTDDYFGLLDNNESISPADKMDIGVGRLLISTPQHAVEQVNKIEHYMKNGSTIYANGTDPNSCCNGTTGSTFGNWRTNYTIVTDDEQNGEFITADGEPVIKNIQLNYPELNYKKLYSDAFQQTSSAGGQRYPEVFEAITESVQQGDLIINYIGHGGETGAAEERIITIPQIQSWTNIDKMALFVTATCEFARFDDPARVSAGEWMALNPIGGGIALMTTSRPVLVSVNTETIRKFYANVFEREADGTPLAFGEILRRTKNATGDSDNKRSFNLIGDPALRIALPRYTIVTDSINSLDPDLSIDTVKALSHMQVKGHIVDHLGNIMTGFNGVLSPRVYDKPKETQTLGNDGAPIIQFKNQNTVLYKGKASVKNGSFSFDFIIPKDINFEYGYGKISYYGESSSTDGLGFDTNFVIGGIDTTAASDLKGPDMDIFLNDDKFVNGGITSPQPVLVVNCFDEFGINTAGAGIGHDLTAILDGETSEPIILNDYYTGNLDSYQSGQILYTMKKMSPGEHTLDVKIWDVNNNSSVQRLEFTVVEDAEIELAHVLNYPNPFTTKTTFFYEHNQSCSALETQVQIYTVSGRLVKTINKMVNSSGFRSEGIEWDGKDDFGDQLAKGVYVYRISVELPDGGKAQKLEKLVLLR